MNTLFHFQAGGIPEELMLIWSGLPWIFFKKCIAQSHLTQAEIYIQASKYYSPDKETAVNRMYTV